MITVTLTWLLIIAILAAALALWDGLTRLRGRRTNSILAVAEVVVAVLMILSFFFTFLSTPGTLVIAIVLEAILLLILLLPGKRTAGATTVTIVAMILNAIFILTKLGWLAIPGLASAL